MVGSMTMMATTLGTYAGWPIVLIVAAMVFAENATIVGLLLPSELTLGVGAILAAQGKVSVGWLLGATIVAALLGDTTGFVLGRRFGAGFIESRAGRFIGTARWDRARSMLDHNSSRAIITGRWISFVRTLMPRLAGMSDVSLRRFIVTDSVAVSLWATGIVTIGYLAGGSLETLESNLRWVVTAVLAVVGAWLSVRWLRRRRHSAPTVTSPAEGALRTCGR